MSSTGYSRSYLPPVVNYSSDVIFNNVAGAALNFDIELGTTLSRFRVINGAGGSLFTVNNSGEYIYSQTSQHIYADTSDTSDNKGLFLCGGGTSSVARGAFIGIRGNEYSGNNGTLSLYAGDASSAYIDIRAATSSSPTIRFTLTSTEQWRMSSSGLLGSQTNNLIATTSDSANLTLQGGASAGPNYGSYLTTYGNSSASYAGSIYAQTGNVSTGHYYYVATHASGQHKFYIGGNEHIRFQAGILFYIAGSGIESTGGGSASLGSNCPAGTLSAPNTWIKIKNNLGEDCFIPAWK